MSAVPLQHTATVAAVTSFIDAAAALEGHLHDAEARAQALQRDLQQLQRRQDHAKKWIVAIRKSHRSHSHAATARVIRQALANLESGASNTVALF